MPEIPAGAIPEHVTIRRDDLLLTLLFVAGDEPVSVMPSEVLDRLFAAASASAVQAPVKECPQSAPGSTESAQTPTSRVSVPPEGAEGVSEPRKDDLRQRYADALSRSLTSPQRGMADHLDAVLAVRDDELAALRQRVAELELTARVSGGLYRSAERDVTASEAAVSRVRALADRWGVTDPGARDEILAALNNPKETNHG